MTSKMSIRIQAIADMVMPGLIPADIGTDHALLPILLVQSGRCRRAYACDIAEGPLKSAEKNISAAGLKESIAVLLSDGFENVPEDADGAILSGMGWRTAVQILDRYPERTGKLKQILVEVNDDVPSLRRWISERHYTIQKEEAAADRNHYYMTVSLTAEYHEAYTEEEILCGYACVQNAVYLQYCQYQRQKLLNIMNKRNRIDAKQILLQKQADLYAKRIAEIKTPLQ